MQNSARRRPAVHRDDAAAGRGVVKSWSSRARSAGSDAEQLCRSWSSRGRETTSTHAPPVQGEVAKQLGWLPSGSTTSRTRFEALLVDRRIVRQPMRRRGRRASTPRIGDESHEEDRARRPRRRGRQEDRSQEGAGQEGAGQEGAAKKPRQEAAAKKRPPRSRRSAAEHRRVAAAGRVGSVGRPQGEHEPPGPQHLSQRPPAPRRRAACGAAWSTSRAEAHGADRRRRVLVNGAIADKPARLVAPGDTVADRRPAAAVRRSRRREARRRARRVRGRRRRAAGARLPARRPAASPTACCSAAPPRSCAVDVGHGQLHPTLRADPRVVVLRAHQHPRPHRGHDRRTGRRRRRPTCRSSRCDGDRRRSCRLCQPGAPMVLLVKPQFEAGRAEVSRGPRRHHRSGDLTSGSRRDRRTP